MADRVARSPTWRVVVAGCLVARHAAAQRVVRPESMWGRVHDHPEGFGFGGVELLTTLVVLLLLLFLVAVWSLAQGFGLRRRAAARSVLARRLDRRERLLGRLTYAAAPAIGIAAIVLAPARTVAGVDIATWVVMLTAGAVRFGAGSLIVDHGTRRRRGL